MECQTCFGVLTAYLDGELSSRQLAEVEHHLGACEGCNEQYRSLQFSQGLVDETLGMDVAPPPWEAIRSQLPETTGRSWSLFGLDFAAWMPAGALAALLLLVSVPYYWNVTDEESILEHELQRYVEYRNRREAIHAITWTADSSSRDRDNPFSGHDHHSENNPFMAE